MPRIASPKLTPKISANLYANSPLPIQTDTSSIIIHKITRIPFLQIKNHKKKMMNFLALGLVLTSLVTAGFFTPTPQNPRSREDDMIVKKGHRVEVAEYEKDDGSTKVLISPHDSQTLHKADGQGFATNVANAQDKLSEKIDGVKGASSSILDETGNLVGNQEDESSHPKFRPRELVCDAYGKCKHKIASAFEKTKESAADTACSAEEAAGKVKDAVAHTAKKGFDKVQEGKEKVKDSANEAFSKVGGAKDERVSKVEEAKEAVSEKAREARKKGQKELREILRHAGEVAGDVFDYVAPLERVGPVAGVVHLMGFAAAYGMCMWITFASSYVLAGALPRQQFAVVQSKIYPVYFKGMGCGVGTALLGHLVGPSRRLSPAVFQGLNLAAALAMILTNLLWLEPQATKVRLERMKKEKEEGIGKPVEPTAETTSRGPSSEEAAGRSQIIQLSRTLEKLNSYSSFLNASTLVSLTWHLVHLGQRLHAAAVC